MFFGKFKWAEDAVLLDSQIETVLALAAKRVRKGVVKENLTTESGLRFSVIGEKGAANLDHFLKQNNLNNLAVAREMLNAGKDAKTIKLATGWEKGGDGKWRMEVPDLKFTDLYSQGAAPVFPTGFLEDVIDAPELFAAYPKLRRLFVMTTEELPENVAGRFSSDNDYYHIFLNRKFFDVTEVEKNWLQEADKEIEMSYEGYSEEHLKFLEEFGLETDPEKNRNKYLALIDKIRDLQLIKYRDTLIHEIQHAIQELEGFARGGNKDTYVPEGKDPVLSQALNKAIELNEEKYSLEKELQNTSPENASKIRHRLKRIDEQLSVLQVTAHEASQGSSVYRRLAGEVEARNATERSRMSAEEKRQSLLADTADVAEESQIYIFGENGASELAEPFTEDQKRRILAMSPRTGVDVIHKILYGGSITRNGNTVFFDGKNSHALKLHLDAPGFTPRRGPVTLEEFEKYLPRALAEKPRVESGKNKKNKKISNKIYKITDNDVIYTLVTASRGEFKSFYSNKKTANAVTDPNRSSATGMLPKHNISQNPENASGDLSDGSDISDVSDELRFSLEEYSESEQDDIVAVLQPFVGRNIDMEPEKYREYLRSKGIQIPDQDADIFFRMAVMANDKAARERANRLRDQWIFENFPIFAEVAEFAGGSDFKIKPVGHEGEDFRLYAITGA